MTEIFTIVPAPAKTYWTLGIIIAVLGLVLALMLYTAYSTRSARFEISPQGLKISGDLFGRTVPARIIVGDEIRRLDLQSSPEYVPRRRTLGTGLPGYAAGWFRLRNGEKALLFVTDRERVVYVPTTEGYALMLSVADTDRFIDRLKSVAAGQQ